MKTMSRFKLINFYQSLIRNYYLFMQILFNIIRRPILFIYNLIKIIPILNHLFKIFSIINQRF